MGGAPGAPGAYTFTWCHSQGFGAMPAVSPEATTYDSRRLVLGHHFGVLANRPITCHWQGHVAIHLPEEDF